MYVESRGSSKSTKVTGAVTTAVVAVGTLWLLANSTYIGEAIEDIRTELVLLSPPPPPPPPPEPELPIEIPEEVVAAPPAPELVAPPIEFVPEEPVIIAPPAPPEPVIIAPPAPPATPVGSGRSPPKLIASDKPDYPSASRRNGEQGTTQLSVCVSAAGRVTSAQVAQSSGHDRLDEAAVKWIRSERFQPAKINGVAQDVCGHKVLYEWNLRDA
jgi:protein TonB